jgi:hypothetical protein
MSEEKTLGEIAYETWCYDISHDAWQAVADAVVAAHEARWWKPIASFGDVQIQGTIGGWLDGEWQIVTGFLFLPYWVGKGYTHVLDTPTRIPAPPQEVEHEA